MDEKGFKYSILASCLLYTSKRDAGDRVAQSRSIDLVADQLVKAYQQVLEM